jgi:hypothetical protein
MDGNSAVGKPQRKNLSKMSNYGKRLRKQPIHIKLFGNGSKGMREIPVMKRQMNWPI